MQVQVLGAHNLESRHSRYVILLIDDVLAIEAAALTSSLTFPAQEKLKAVLLTHQHYDHIKDIPALGMNFLLHEKTIEICSTRPVYEVVAAHLLNDELYPNFMAKPPERPTARFRVIAPGQAEQIAGYTVLAVPVNHAVPAVGYQVTSADGRAVFYSSDTGPGLDDCWRQVSPDLLFIEVTAPDRYEEFARRSGHLTPGLLGRELDSFRRLKGYLPQVVLVHMNPEEENDIADEIAAVARSLDTTIQLGYEGMKIHL
jgi:ribonuclease BN (tRNA processing enzyme)